MIKINQKIETQYICDCGICRKMWIESIGQRKYRIVGEIPYGDVVVEHIIYEGTLQFCRKYVELAKQQVKFYNQSN